MTISNLLQSINENNRIGMHKYHAIIWFVCSTVFLRADFEIQSGGCQSSLFDVYIHNNLRRVYLPLNPSSNISVFCACFVCNAHFMFPSVHDHCDSSANTIFVRFTIQRNFSLIQLESEKSSKWIWNAIRNQMNYHGIMSHCVTMWRFFIS